MTTQIIYRKIRRYTPTRNESSWVWREDGFIRHHTSVSTSGRCAMSHLCKESETNKEFDATCIIRAPASTFRANPDFGLPTQNRHKFAKSPPSQFADIPYTALIEKILDKSVQSFLCQQSSIFPTNLYKYFYARQIPAKHVQSFLCHAYAKY